MSNILIHVGYRKAGSTFIRDWFYFHPELKMGGINTNSEFCRFEYFETHPKYFVFSDAFLLFKGNSTKRTIPNIKKYQVDTCRLLKDLFPVAKILLITRSPETSITSEYSEYVKNGGTLTFDELINNTEAIEHFLGYYDYNFAIDLYCNAFGKKNVIVLPMEFLEDKPEPFIKTIEDRLGLTHYEFNFNKRNPSLSPNKLFALRKLSVYIKQATQLLGKYGDYLFVAYVKYLGRESYNNNKFPLLSSAISFFSTKTIYKITVPQHLVDRIKENATELKNNSEFNNYIHKYCM